MYSTGLQGKSITEIKEKHSSPKSKEFVNLLNNSGKQEFVLSYSD